MKNKKLCKLIIWNLIMGLTFQATPVWALTKNETIYAKMDYTGRLNSAIATEHISNNNDILLTDISSLENITNVNGNESYKEIDKKIVWEANGNDIYYQGNVKKDLPINMSILYYLNGEEMDAKEMLGKAGNVKIKIKYENMKKNNVIVNGKNEVLYTPFVVSTISMINNKDNKNVKVTNGKVIDNGINKMVVAIAAPGLYESLDLNKLKGLDEITISYETEKFELSSIYAVATSKLLEDSDLDIFNDVDKLYEKIDTLNNSSNMLVSGSEKLVDGSKKLTDGASQLVGGIDNAYVGSKTINSSVKDAILKLEKESNTSLDEQTLEYISKQAVTQATLSNAQKDEIAKNVMKQIQDNPEYQQLSSEYNNLVKNETELLAAISQYEAAGMVDKVEEAKVQLEAVKSGKEVYKKMIYIMEQTAYKTAEATADAVAYKVAEEVSKNVASSVATTVKKEMGSQVVNSLNTLSLGLEELNNGLYTIKLGMNSLYDGTKELDEGLKTLNNGLITFNNEGVKKISNLVNTEVKDIESKMKILIRLSNEYKTLDDVSDDSEGSSKIIIVVDGIKLEEDKKEKTAIVEEDKNIVEKVKGLFKK